MQIFEFQSIQLQNNFQVNEKLGSGIVIYKFSHRTQM